MIDGSRVVVTGGAGFIGSHLVERLASRNTVSVFDIVPPKSATNLDHVRDQINYVQGDVTAESSVETAVEGADVVFHLAALISPAESFRDPVRVNEVNTHGTLSVLRAAKRAGVKRVVFASSCAVYGGTPPPLREDAPLDLLSPYSVTKAAGELWCRLYHDLGQEATALRLFNVYGPRQPPRGEYAAVIPKFLEAVLDGRQPVIYGDGEQTRDFVYVGDVAEAFERAATATDAPGEIINVGSGEGFSLNRLLGIIGDILGAPLEARRDAPRAGDIRFSYADPDKMERVLGWRPRVSLPQGLLATAEWMRSR